MTTVFMQPLDVLLLRGNKLFGDAGSYGDALVPPWPSVAAGALRSRMLTDAGMDWSPARNRQPVNSHPEIGAPDKPGPFTVTAFHLARRLSDGRVELLVQPPADLVLSEQRTGDERHLIVRRLAPQPRAAGLQSSSALACLLVLAEPKWSKPVGNRWLTQAGWETCLRGETPDSGHFVANGELWQKDVRVGVGLDADKRAAAEGRLFTVEAVAMFRDVGFAVRVAGAAPPASGFARLGGDGRAAALRPAVIDWPQADLDAITRNRRCRLVLTSPGIFSVPLPHEDDHEVKAGWLPTGADLSRKREDSAVRFELHGVAGWIVCAAVPRFEVVSGWDLAKWEPKPALRAVPTGSVYWLELDEGVTADALRKLVDRGLWTDKQYDSDMRRAEGFNRLALAVWK